MPTIAVGNDVTSIRLKARVGNKIANLVSELASLVCLACGKQITRATKIKRSTIWDPVSLRLRDTLNAAIGR